jgi:hypothetical protein
MNYVRWLVVLVTYLVITPQEGACQNYSNSPEAVGSIQAATATPTPPPSPTPSTQVDCPSGQTWDYSDGRCEDCLYALTNFRESFVSDGDPTNTVGKDGTDHWQLATFGPNDVVLGIGSPDDTAVFRDIQGFLDNSITACFNPDPTLVDANGNPLPILTPPPTATPNATQAADPNYTPPPTATPSGGRYASVWDTGWNTQFSQCVAYRAYERYHLFAKNPDGTFSEAQDPTYSFQFRVPNGHRWWFSDIREMWVKNSNGDLIRRELPNGAYFEEDRNGMFIAYFDKDGNRIDPTTILDPSYTPGAPVNASTDPNFANDHTPRLRAGLNKSICHTWEVRGVASPISLFMPGCDIRELEPTIVKFPLNPHDKNSYTTWNASKCMPLLVVDPTHSGIISSGAQLLGDWTYGGAPTYDESIKPWKHGFQVLATFDKNGDGIVSEGELASLSVWSDANQNGISEPGEVTAAQEFGVKQLRYQSPKNFRHGDLFIEAGYKLKYEGNVVDGMLIDWYGQTAKTEQELIPVLPFNAVSKDSSPIKKYRRSCSEKDLTSFAGGWRWWLDSDPKKITRGYITLGQPVGDTLVGNTFSIQTAKRTGSSLDSMLGSWPLKARVQGREGVMSIPSAKGGVVSEISLSEDGTQMNGTTRSTSSKGKGLLYSWTAKRVGCDS